MSCLSSSTSFMVRVTSTVTNSVTCGAVNAEPTIAWAVALRTPLIGTRVSRAVSYEAAGAGAAAAGVSTGAGAAVGAGGATAACTSSRVMMPSGPDGITVARSTPRSLASLRTGGLASGRGRSSGTGGAAGAGPWPFSSVWIAVDAWATATSGPLRGRRLVEEVATP